MNKLKIKYIFLLLLIIILVAVDQLSKYFIRRNLKYHHRYTVLKHILSFEYVENRGVAFGLFSGKKLIITVTVVLVTICIIYALCIIENAISSLNKLLSDTVVSEYADNNGIIADGTQMNIDDDIQIASVTKKFVTLQIICIFLIAGSIGNMVDRIRCGYVVDFFQFDFINFPVFNIADCYVTISVFVLLVMVLFFLSDKEISLLKLRK